MNTFQLNEAQLALLKDVYEKRRNLLFGSMTGISLLCLVVYLREMLEEPVMAALVYGAIWLYILGIMAILYLRKVLPVRKDMQLKLGFYKPLRIARKSAFEHVGKCYLFFDDLEFPNKEVSPADYLLLEIGAVYALPCSKCSRIVLDGFANYPMF